jgi:4-amino-4-deoxy-L-arabinose transferase-like glycosyltransferase
VSRLRTFRTQLALVALAGFGVRAWAVLTWGQSLGAYGDQLFYTAQAQALAKGQGFVYLNSYGERVTTAVHPPLHSALMALVRIVPFDGDNYTPFRLACALIGTGTVVVVGLAARRVAGPRAGIIAALFAAVYPNLWINDVLMLSESTFSFAIALVLYASALLWDEPTPRASVLLGVSVALAALSRAEAQLLLLLLVVPLAYFLRGLSLRERAKRGGIAILTAVIVMAPWLARNYLTFSAHPVGVSTASGFVIEISNCDQTYGIVPSGGETPPTDVDKFLGYWAPECDRTPWPAGDETVVNAAKQKAGVDYILAHKSRFPVVVAARIGRIWDVWRPGQSYDFNRFFERRGDWPTIGGMAMYYPLLIASVAGLVVLRRRRQTLVPYLAIFAVTTFTAAISFGITRYRVGADVALTVLAAVAVDALLRRWRPVADERPRARGDDDRDGPSADGPIPARATTDATPAGALA